MIATQSEIARQLGISQATVSMALRGTGKMSEETRSLIQREAIKLGYRHNNSAQAIRTGRFGCISLLLSMRYQHSYLPYELIPGIVAEARAQQTQLSLIGSPDQELINEEFIHEALRRWSSDGLLINYTHNFPLRMVDLIRDYRVPSVWMNAKLEVDSVYPDDIEAAAQSVRHLIELGHRRIGYVDLTRNQHYSGQDRYDGYAETMLAQDLPLNPLTRLVPRPDRYPIVKKWLESSNRPSAVITYRDHEAYAIYAAAMELHIRVPQDLSIIAIHDFPADTVGVAFSTMKNDFGALGAEAVKMLMQKIQKPAEFIPSRKITPQWLPGATTAPPA